MSTLRVNNIQFNPDGNTIISAVNTNNIVITVDGTEKLKEHKDGFIFRGPVSINSTPIFDGSGSLVVSLSNSTLASPNLTNTIDANGSIRYALTALTGNTVNCAQGNFFQRTANGAASWFTNNIPSNRAYTMILELTNGGTGTQTWFANTRWAGGTAPTLTASGVDVLAFITDDAGANWRGVALMTDSK